MDDDCGRTELVPLLQLLMMMTPAAGFSFVSGEERILTSMIQVSHGTLTRAGVRIRSHRLLLSSVCVSMCVSEFQAREQVRLEGGMKSCSSREDVMRSDCPLRREPALYDEGPSGADF